jgi:hypothetical protein
LRALQGKMTTQHWHKHIALIVSPLKARQYDHVLLFIGSISVL